MLLNDLIRLFFPNNCLLCERPLVQGEEEICLNCLTDLPYTRFTPQENQRVADLFIGKIPFEKAAAMLHFKKGSAVQKIIHAIKYHHNRRLAFLLGVMAAKELGKNRTDFFQNIDYIVPVPLHPKRERKRGYNQAELIAQGIGSFTHIPVLNDLIIRNRSNESQTHKQLYERFSNVKDLFSLSTAHSDFSSQHVLLVDDVITTGSTLSSCALPLLKLPDVKISLLGIAIAVS